MSNAFNLPPGVLPSDYEDKPSQDDKDAAELNYGDFKHDLEVGDEVLEKSVDSASASCDD